MWTKLVEVIEIDDLNLNVSTVYLMPWTLLHCVIRSKNAIKTKYKSKLVSRMGEDDEAP